MTHLLEKKMNFRLKCSLSYSQSQLYNKTYKKDSNIKRKLFKTSDTCKTITSVCLNEDFVS